ncbi:hypothetical protein PF008_g8935 [Phytophthora fragariae]|uniref:RxLR effector protein n=1 Tax=Phytophthora fragariae TaxID=53985 RepID=A0A6G0RY72_9STRA|nr:hypothetical protein PF008_g8935 [Phytophthora fragariae]
MRNCVAALTKIRIPCLILLSLGVVLQPRPANVSPFFNSNSLQPELSGSELGFANVPPNSSSLSQYLNTETDLVQKPPTTTTFSSVSNYLCNTIQY